MIRRLVWAVLAMLIFVAVGYLADMPKSAPAIPPPAVDATACVAPAGTDALIDQDRSDEQLPWKRNRAHRVVVYFAAQGLSDEWRRDLQDAAAQWNKSPCLDTRVVDTCAGQANCVTVSAVNTGDDGNFDAVETAGFTAGGHITLLNTLTANQKRNVAVHEMGHAVGLAHRKTAHVLMNGETYDDVFEPDVTDYRNLLFDYGRQD